MRQILKKEIQKTRKINMQKGNSWLHYQPNQINKDAQTKKAPNYCTIILVAACIFCYLIQKGLLIVCNHKKKILRTWLLLQKILRLIKPQKKRVVWVKHKTLPAVAVRSEKIKNRPAYWVTISFITYTINILVFIDCPFDDGHSDSDERVPMCEVSRTEATTKNFIATIKQRKKNISNEFFMFHKNHINWIIS